MTSGAGRNITYTSFNMVASIAQGTVSVAIGYDSEHNRVSQTLAVGSNAATTIYLNDPITGAMSEKLTSGSTVVWHDYIASAGGVVAEKFSGGTTAVRYFVADHLGSAAAAMDEAGRWWNAIPMTPGAGGAISMAPTMRPARSPRSPAAATPVTSTSMPYA